VQSDASFCGQCGFNLKAAVARSEEPAVSATIAPDFMVPPDPLPPDPVALPNIPIEAVSPPDSPLNSEVASPDPAPVSSNVAVPNSLQHAAPATMAQAQEAPNIPPASKGSYATQIQTQHARLLHLQTNTSIELPQNLSVIHVGKPNDRIPPDIDVSGFPSSEIVSRIHADIRVEGDAYYVEDVGSSNGTYINNIPLPMGNRHRLRSGDRIALGKGDRVTFLFQLA
jgi:hypothetical protein